MRTHRHAPSPQHQLRAFLYARASADRKGRGSSTNAQMIENRRECEDRDWAIVGEFTDDNRSASRYAKRKRDRFDEMVGRVRAGEADVIVTWENSRLQRDLEVYVQIRKLCMETNTLWCYNGDVYDMSKRQDRKRTALDAVASEDEVEVIRDRNLRTVRLNAEAMRPHGRIVTGYARRYDPETGDLVEQVPDEKWAPIIRRIFEEFVGGVTAYGIATGLNREGILTSTGKAWSDTGILAVLKRPTYAGYRVFQGQIIGRGLWEPLIDELTWQQSQAILADPRRAKMRDTTVVHLLSGIPVCGECGGPVGCDRANGGFSYICRDSFCVAIRDEIMEAYVEERLIKWLKRPEAALAFQDVDRDAEVDDAIAVVAQLTDELDQARAAAKAGTLSVASLIAVEAGILPRLTEAEAVVRRGSGASPLVASLLGQRDAEPRWGALLMEQKRTVLREVSAITLNGALKRGVSTLYEGRIRMNLGPQG